MLNFICQRLIATIAVLAVVALFVFFLLRLTPGDPAALIAGDNATASQIADIREKLGLSQPIWTQFAIWIGNVLHGDLGESYFFKMPVTELISQRIEATLALTVGSLVIAISTAVPAGVLAAYKHGSLADRLIMGFAVLGFSVPSFVIGYCLIYLFALKLGWLPVQGYVSISVDFWRFVRSLVLPSVTLGLVFMALIARITRAAVLDVLNEDYIRTARAKGVGDRVVLFHHALRNAAVPIITVIGQGVALLIGGAVVTETVFGLPGLGRLTVEAVLSRDFPTIQAVILVFSTTYVLINMLIDLSYSLLDPRIRF